MATQRRTVPQWQFGIALGVSLLLVMSPYSAFAVTPAVPAPSAPSPSTSGQALEIAPPILTLRADPGQTITAQINIRDISRTKLQVSSQVNDFRAAGEDGTPKILLDETESDPYSIKSWVQPLPDMILTPQEIKVLPVTIRVPASASPGGHYGVIRFSAKAPEVNASGVSLSASLGTLVFITVSGNATEKLTVEEFAVSKDGKKGTFFETAPLTFMQRLKNSGNVHEQPAGQVNITDMFGKPVANLGVNMPPRNILPNSIRRFEQPLDKSVIGTKRLFGRYKATLNLTYGANKQKLQAVQSFWVVPWKLISLVLIALVAGGLSLRSAIKRYNRRIIQKAQQQRPPTTPGTPPQQPPAPRP